MHLARLLEKSLIAALALAAGCRSTNNALSAYNAQLASGRYAEAAVVPQELAAKADGSQLLWRLLAGSALDLAGDAQGAIAQFDAAENRMVANDNTSVFSQTTGSAAAMALNDKVYPYDGGGQDRVFTCLYKAADYGAMRNLNAMRTELNRATQWQEDWLWQRRKDLDAAESRMAKDSAAYAKDKSGGKTSASDATKSDAAVSKALQYGPFAESLNRRFSFDVFTSGVLDRMTKQDYINPYVSHVTGVFRWTQGDSARNHLRDARDFGGGNTVAREDFAACEAGAPPRNTVWVYVEDGLCPTRQESRLDLPLLLIPYAGHYVKYAGICLPVLVARPNGAGVYAVNGARAEVLANVDKLVKIEYDVYMRGAIAREITRTIVDAGVQAALGIVADNASDWKVKYALKASQYAAAAYSALRRGADVRSWTALPKRVLVARLPRPADGVIDIRADGLPVAQVTVPAGNSMVFVRKVAPTAPAAVKTVAL